MERKKENISISIVTTMFYSEPYLLEFYNRIKKTVEKITKNYEIIFVDDGSPDKALEMALEFHKQNNKVKVIELSRNFGHQKAMITGITNTIGDYVFLIDCDLEEEPELLSDFWKKLTKEENYDVIYGVQKKRKGGLFEKLSGFLFYYFFNKISNIKIPKNELVARLMNRNYVNALIKYNEEDPVFGGLAAHAGFRQFGVPVTKKHKGKTTYNSSRKIKLFVNTITSFSARPLYYIFLLGVTISFVSGLYILYLILLKFIMKESIVGWTSTIVSIWFLGGLMLFSLGIIGIYIERIFNQIKNRPFVNVRNYYGIKSLNRKK